MNDDPNIKRIAEQQDTIINFALGYFILGPLAMFALFALIALVAWLIP